MYGSLIFLSNYFGLWSLEIGVDSGEPKRKTERKKAGPKKEDRKILDIISSAEFTAEKDQWIYTHT